MAKYGNNSEVIYAYFNGDAEPFTNGNGSISFRSGVLYSYGEHFPLAFKLSDGRYLINGDRYSVTTSAHQSLCHRACPPGGERFTSSVSALQRALRREGFGDRDFEKIEVVDALPGVDIRNYYINELSAQKEYDALEDKQGVTLTYKKHPETEEHYLDHAHRAETLLLKIGRGFWVCGMDDRSYFISKLPKRARSMTEAFDIMKPDKVKQWEVETGCVAARQGEWFFIQRLQAQDVIDAKVIYKKMQTSNEMRSYHDYDEDGNWARLTKPVNGFILPRESGSNPHTATRGYIKNRRVFVSGQVRHPEHPTLKLSYAKDPVIFEAVKNTTVADFSADGRVD